jgi:hypothetical protein
LISFGIIIILIIIAGIFIEKRRRKTRQRTLDRNLITELRNVNNASANRNAQSSLLQEP